MMRQLAPKSVWVFFIQAVIIFWIFLIPLYIFLAMALAAGSFVLSIFLFAISIGLPYLYARLTYRFWRYELGEDVVKVEKGIIWKKYISIPYDRIQNVDIHRGILTRLFGLSDLQIQTAGYSGGYKGYGPSTEGRLPGLDRQVAEQLRDDLIKKVKKGRGGGV